MSRPLTALPLRQLRTNLVRALGLMLLVGLCCHPAHAQVATAPQASNTSIPGPAASPSLMATHSTLASANSTTSPSTTATPSPSPSPELLSFKEFFQFPVGPRGLDIHPRLQQANGQPVRLRGYMVQQDHGSHRGQFLFTPRPVQMSEHADGDADDLPPATVLVKLAPAQSTWVVPHTPGLIELAGILSVGRHEADDGRVTWVQLQLQP